MNPSVSTLYALVRELGLTMGDLFAAEDGAAPASRPARQQGRPYGQTTGS